MDEAPYYTLLTRENRDSPWTIQFGDYDRAIVVQECSDMLDEHAYRGLKRENTRILRTHTDTQADIEATVRELNNPRSPQPNNPEASMTPDEFKAAIKTAGHTQRSFAVLVGVDANTATRWATGKTPVPVYARLIIGLLSENAALRETAQMLWQSGSPLAPSPIDLSALRAARDALNDVLED